MKLALTHYDILNVTRDAPQEVIRAAYKALCRKYHPDLNADSADTNHVMAVINVSYDILSSASRRCAYDDWIAEQESLHGRAATLMPSWERLTLQVSPWKLHLSSRATLAMRNAQAAASHVWQHAAVYALASLVMAMTILALWSPESYPTDPEYASSQPSPMLATQEPQPMPPSPSFPQLVLTKSAAGSSVNVSAGGYNRSRQVPNGQTWPAKAGYLKNAPILNDDGSVTVNVENGTNNSDVHAKLVALHGLREEPVREFYIPAHGSFSLQSLSPGRYEVRYINLENGRLARSEEIVVAEGAALDRPLQAKITVSLGKMQNTRMEAIGLLEIDN